MFYLTLFHVNPINTDLALSLYSTDLEPGDPWGREEGIGKAKKQGGQGLYSQEGPRLV